MTFLNLAFGKKPVPSPVFLFSLLLSLSLSIVVTYIVLLRSVVFWKFDVDSFLLVIQYHWLWISGWWQLEMVRWNVLHMWKTNICHAWISMSVHLQQKCGNLHLVQVLKMKVEKRQWCIDKEVKTKWGNRQGWWKAEYFHTKKCWHHHPLQISFELQILYVS